MRFRTFAANVESGDAPNEFKVIERTIPNPIVNNCDVAAFTPCLPDAIPNTAAALAYFAGLSNARTVGFISSAVCGFALKNDQIFTKHSLRWGASLFASGSFNTHFVRRS